MNTLYLLGGPPRVGKSIIMGGLMCNHPMHLISSDAVSAGIRSLLIDDSSQILRQVSINGWAEYKKRGTEDILRKEFSKQAHEYDFTQQELLGLIEHYERNKLDVSIEGVHITPSWVKSLNLKGYKIRAAFVGYLSPNYANSILEHANNNGHDWINEKIALHGGDESFIREWVAEQIEINKKTDNECKKLGFPFFDSSAKPFNEYVDDVQNFLLNVS